MNQRFIQAVAEHDLKKIRLSISNELLLDPRGLSFYEMVKYASDNISDLFEDDDNSEIISDMALWNEEYLSGLHVKLNKNFSKIKLEHFEDVAKIVLKAKIEELNSREHNYSNPNSHTSDTNPGGRGHSNRKELCFIAGGAISSLVGLCVDTVPVKVTLIAAGLASIAYGVYNFLKKES